MNKRHRIASPTTLGVLAPHLLRPGFALTTWEEGSVTASPGQAAPGDTVSFTAAVSFTPTFETAATADFTAGLPAADTDRDANRTPAPPDPTQTTGPVTQLPSTGAGDDHTNQSVLAIAAIVSLFLMVVAAASSRTHRRQRR